MRRAHSRPASNLLIGCAVSGGLGGTILQKLSKELDGIALIDEDFIVSVLNCGNALNLKSLHFNGSGLEL